MPNGVKGGGRQEKGVTKDDHCHTLTLLECQSLQLSPSFNSDECHLEELSDKLEQSEVSLQYHTFQQSSLVFWPSDSHHRQFKSSWVGFICGDSFLPLGAISRN